MTNFENLPAELKRVWKINKITKVKYISEIIHLKGLIKEANKLGRRKLLVVGYQLTKDIYRKKDISNKTKIKYQNSVIKPECLYTTKCTFIIKTREIKGIEEMKKKIFKKIWDRWKQKG